tara:strand:- start:151 stop:378 length:228 start_codon:yes stop_codon:yes gene_type:complete
MEVFTLFLPLRFEKALQEIEDEKADGHKEQIVNLNVVPQLIVDIEQHGVLKLSRERRLIALSLPNGGHHAVEGFS